jgi:hypothetical protein
METKPFNTKRLERGALAKIAQEKSCSHDYVSSILNGKSAINTPLAKSIIQRAEQLATEYEVRLGVKPDLVNA